MLTSDKLTCQEAVELVTDYLETALLAEMQAKFDQHLETCAGCVVYLDQMRQTIQTLRQLTAESTPSQTQQALTQQFRDWQKDNRNRP